MNSRFKKLLRIVACMVAFTVLLGSFAYAQDADEPLYDDGISDEYDANYDDLFKPDESIGSDSSDEKVDVNVEEQTGIDVSNKNDKIDAGVSIIPSENNAYVVMSNEVRRNHIQYVDGFEEGIIDQENPGYCEPFEMDGVLGRRVYKTNYLDFVVDKDYYQPGDSKFMVMITFYDFGPSEGYFHFDYANTDGVVSRISVLKPGVVPKWRTTKFVIENADFTKLIDEKYNFRLVSNLYNAFAKVELVNISVAERSDAYIDLGSANGIQAEALDALNVMKGENGAPATAGLDKKLTRGELIKMLVKAFTKEDEALGENNKCSFSDVPGDLAPYVAYGEKIGMISGSGSGKFNPDEYATPRQMLTFMMRYLGISDDNLYENSWKLGNENGFINGMNLILYPDGPLSRDNYAAILYNGSMIESKKTGNTILLDNVLEGVFTEEDAMSTGIKEIMAYRFMAPRKIPKKTFVDATSGRTYHYMDFDGLNAIRTYFHQQSWNEEETKFLIANRETGAFYEYDINTEMLSFLDYAVVESVVYAEVVANDQIYYEKDDGSFWHMDWKTREKRKIADRHPDSMTATCLFSVSWDGKYIATMMQINEGDAGYINGTHRYKTACRLNTETGVWDKVFYHEFNDTPDYPSIGHPIINPQYHEISLFCHEGTTEYVPDRIWLGNFETGETWNLFKQGIFPGGRMTTECTGHEMWQFDGEHVIFVKYPKPQNDGKSGLARVSLDGTEVEYFNGDYTFWHITTNREGDWIAGDMQGEFFGVAMVSTKSYDSHLLAKFGKGPHNNHPFQPHPTLSWRGNYISWQQSLDGKGVGISWMDVSDLNNTDYEGGLFDYNENLSYIDYDNTKFDVEKVTMSGNECFKAAKDKSIYFDIKDEVVRTAEGDVEIEITYLDNCMVPLEVVYTNTTKEATNYGNFEDKTIEIPRNGTGKWKTAKVQLKKASLEDSCSHLTDFALRGQYSDCYIKDVKVTVK